MKGSKLFVGNLSFSVTSDELKGLFGAHGTVVEVKLFGDKGFGFVEMGSQTEAEEAKKALDGHNLGGRTIKVDEAQPKGAGGGNKQNRRF